MANHRYVADAPEFVKSFERNRTFILVSYEALNARDMIGSFGNGIAVLDPDNREVVFDAHFQGKEKNIKSVEFERIKAMDWKKFSEFVRNHPRYGGGIGDIDAGGPPAAGDLINQSIAQGKLLVSTGPSILPSDISELDTDPKTNVKFDHKTREEMIVFLALHQSYYPMRPIDGGFVIAWDIKATGKVDMTGANYGNNPVSPEFDKTWNDHIKTNGSDLYDKARKEGFAALTEGNFTSLKGNDTGYYKFCTNGVLDNYLILEDFKGLSAPGKEAGLYGMVFSGKNEYIQWLKDLSEKDLVSLYVLVASVDFFTKNPHEIISRQIGFQRGIMEEKWEMELIARQALEAKKSLYKPKKPSTSFP